MSTEKNVLGSELMACSFAPLTGYFRDGSCATHGADGVAHLVCVRVTQEFLEFSMAKGNDLSTPRPEMRFRGLQPGDRWCLHVLRWVEAWRAFSAAGGARGHPRERAGLRAALGAQAARARPELASVFSDTRVWRNGGRFALLPSARADMPKISKDRLDAVRGYLREVFPDWALAESWDGDREAQNFLLKKPREPLHLLKVSRSVLDQCGPRKLAGLLEGHQVADALRRAEKHRLLLTQRGLDQL